MNPVNPEYAPAGAGGETAVPIANCEACGIRFTPLGNVGDNAVYCPDHRAGAGRKEFPLVFTTARHALPRDPERFFVENEERPPGPASGERRRGPHRTKRAGRLLDGAPGRVRKDSGKDQDDPDPR